MFFINLFLPFKAGIQKASLTMGYSTTTLQLTWYTERTSLPEKFASRVLFLFNLGFSGIYLLKINFFNRTLNEST